MTQDVKQLRVKIFDELSKIVDPEINTTITELELIDEVDIADTRDKGKKNRLQIIDESHGIWRCHAAGSCSQVCPNGVDPAMGIQMLRSYLLGIRD